MENIVDDVEDERENECSPADPECCKDSVGCDGMMIPSSVNHGDGVSS